MLNRFVSGQKHFFPNYLANNFGSNLIINLIFDLFEIEEAPDFNLNSYLNYWQNIFAIRLLHNLIISKLIRLTLDIIY